jgi:DNA recombination protein RmuC
LSAKSYWSQFEHSPEFVILFIPGDQFLTAALNEKPDLLEEALRQKVMLITPTSLVALLKVIAYGWLQLSLSDNAEQIRGLAEDLHDRLASFTGHLARVGKQLDASVTAYNQAVGSLEGRVLPGARKFSELGVRTRKALHSPTTVEASARPIKSLTGGEPVVLDDGSTAEAEADEPVPDPPASRH